MKKSSIVIADTDENFAAQIQNYIEKKLGDAAEISIVTSMVYLDKLFSTPQSIDVLLIDNGLYFKNIEKHSIGSICIISDDPDECSRKSNGYLTYIYRFSSVKEIGAKVLSQIDDERTGEFKNSGTKAVLVTSPCGGVGKTITALAVSGALSNNGKKVLYVDTSNVQSSAFWLKSSKKLKSDIDIADNLNSSSISNAIVKGSFDYIAPVKSTLNYLGANDADFNSIITSIKDANTYDYVVIDSEGGFDNSDASLINISDNVIILTLQDKFSISKLNKVLNTIDCTDKDKFKVICSHYKDSVKSYFDLMEQNVEVSFKIPYANLSDADNIEQIASLNCFKRIGAMLS